jgi:hypothetical protein
VRDGNIAASPAPRCGPAFYSRFRDPVLPASGTSKSPCADQPVAGRSEKHRADNPPIIDLAGSTTSTKCISKTPYAGHLLLGNEGDGWAGDE